MVLVSDELPRPGLAGHLAMNHAALAFLAARGHPIHILLPGARLDVPMLALPPGLEAARVEGPALRQRGRRLWAMPRLAARILARRALLALPAALRDRLRHRARAGRYGGAEVVLGRSLDAAEVAWAAGRIAALRPRAVLVDTIFRAPLLRHPALAGIPSVLLTHDIFHARHASLAARGLRLHPPDLTAATETELLALAGTLAAIQPEDAAALRALLPGHPIILAGMPALPRPRPPGVVRAAGRFVFLGSDSAPNLDGLRWFLADIWPLIRAAAPTAQLDICGSAGPALATLPPGVTARGVVADLGPWLHRASCAVAPVLAGSGLKIKMLDYLAHGLPVVATPLAAAGMPLDDGAAPVAVADTPTAFAAAALRFGLAGAAEQAAREAAALGWLGRHYAPDQALGALAAAIEAP